MAGPWLTWPLHTVEQKQPWTTPDGIALIGDAAHAMTPFAAQGAAMAIEDAATLAGSFAAFPADPARGLPAVPEARVKGVMTVSKSFDLLGLAWKENVGTKEQQVEVLSEWVVALEVDKPIDPNVFKVR